MILHAKFSRYTLLDMENHPIPQDITGFKFRLIGSITIKQFLYLLGAGGVVLILYILQIPWALKIPLMIIPITVSLALAFVPIDGRPMDKMIFNFARAIPAENEFIYKKHGVEMPYFSFTPPAHAQTQMDQSRQGTAKKALLLTQFNRSYFKLDKEEQEGIESISALFQESATPNQGFTTRVIHADTQVQQSAPAPLPTEVVSEDKKEEVLAAPHLPPVQTPPQPASQQSAPPVVPPPTIDSSFDSPNVIKGIVRDPRGKPLPHIIVEIMDENHIPRRTFRTGQNGMFSAGTAIPNGTYVIHLEDTLKKQDFEDKTLEVNGSILPLIEVTSVDQREKLRRELFGQT